MFHQNVRKNVKKKPFLMNIIVQQYKKLCSELSFSSQAVFKSARWQSIQDSLQNSLNEFKLQLNYF